MNQYAAEDVKRFEEEGGVLVVEGGKWDGVWFKACLFLVGALLSGLAHALSSMTDLSDVKKDTEFIKSAIKTNQEAISGIITEMDRVKTSQSLGAAERSVLKQRVDHYDEETRRISDSIHETRAKIETQGQSIQKIEVGVAEIRGDVRAIKESVSKNGP